MLRSCGICSAWGRRSAGDGSGDTPRFDRASAAAAGTDGVRPHPLAPSPYLRRESRRHQPPLPCCCASVPAAVGSLSPRPSAPSSALRRPGIEIALVPITTAGDRDRTKPFGEIGERGVFVKELEEALLAGSDRRRRPLREGHDVDGHDGPRRRRVSRAGRSARRAVRRRRRRARDADRHRVGAASRPAAGPRADVLDRAAAWKHRYAPAQARRAGARRDRARRRRARQARARGRDRPPVRPRRLLPEAAQGALALQVRLGEEDARRRARSIP